MVTAQRCRRLLALTAAMTATVALGAPAGLASADTQAPEVRYVANTVYVNPARPDVAVVTGSYRCFGGTPIHFWVSVKQGGPDPTAEGSGATATAWYDTNTIGAPTVICDGQWHTIRVNVGRHFDKGPLVNGPAWVQFCLVSDTGIVASESLWVRVAGA